MIGQLTPTPETDMELVGEKDRALIARCIHEGHDSIFEHVEFTFEVDFSRVAQAQMLRHRIASYSAESSRAVDFTHEDDVTKRFFIPHTIKHDEKVISYSDPYGDEEKARDLFWDTVEHCMATYRSLIEAGIPVEDARYVLPLALMQPVVMTMNLRQWRHVIAARTCKHAQHEIRYVAKEIRRQFDLLDDLYMKDAENFRHCPHNSTCGECLTNWEGMESDSSVKEI
jgi:thymidylate synthase (FAD)